MDLWISAEVESDVFDDFRLSNNALEDDLKPFFSNSSYDLALDSLDCIAIIRNDSVFEEVKRYSPKKRDMDFRLAIDHAEFKSSTFEERKALIFEMILRALDILSTKKSINKDHIQRLKNDLINYANEKCQITT